MRILKLPAAVKEQISLYKLSERHARALLRLHNEDAQLKLIRDIKQKNLSVKLTEDLVERTLAKLYGEVPSDMDKQHVVCLMRDYRIYLNTIKKALSRIKNQASRSAIRRVNIKIKSRLASSLPNRSNNAGAVPLTGDQIIRPEKRNFFERRVIKKPRRTHFGREPPMMPCCIMGAKYDYSYHLSPIPLLLAEHGQKKA